MPRLRRLALPRCLVRRQGGARRLVQVGGASARDEGRVPQSHLQPRAAARHAGQQRPDPRHRVAQAQRGVAAGGRGPADRHDRHRALHAAARRRRRGRPVRAEVGQGAGLARDRARHGCRNVPLKGGAMRDKDVLLASETAFTSPIPTQIVSSDEYRPAPQTEQQRRVEARLKEVGQALAGRLGMSRRKFFRTASGMAASYLVMNQVYGPLFSVSEAEASTPELAEARAETLKGQMVFDAHTHFLSDTPSPAYVDPSRTGNLMWQRALMARLGWNKDIAGREATIADLKFDNFLKEIYLDSDTKVALLTNAPSTAPADWLLPQEIGRASCREREERGVVAGSVQQKGYRG